MKIRAEGLVKVYGKRKVVKGVSIEVKKGEIVGLLGPNGAGKTTTFYMVVGFVKPNEGNVYLNDENITSLPMYRTIALHLLLHDSLGLPRVHLLFSPSTSTSA